jgi:hypothetical protein
MATDYFLSRKQSSMGDGLDPPASPTSTQPRSNPLATKVTSVLSASYADSDIRDALTLLDKRGLQNNPETRRQLRLDAQKEVIESNGDIIKEFGHVAEVCLSFLGFVFFPVLTLTLAIEAYWSYNSQSKPRLRGDEAAHIGSSSRNCPCASRIC